MIVKHTTAEGRTVSVDVSEATVRDMLRRTSLMQRSVQDAKDDQKQGGLFIGLMRLNSYPACVGSSSEFHDSDDTNMTIEGMTFDVFLGVPQQFMDAWLAKVYELNPSWSPEAVVPQMRPSDGQETSKSASTDD